MNELAKVEKRHAEYDAIAARSIITEREILRLKHRMNTGERGPNRIFVKGNLAITPEQTRKGIKWLRDKYAGKSGKVRKHNPFGKREVALLKAFDHFELVRFENRGTLCLPDFEPVYRVVSKHGRHFDYVARYDSRTDPLYVFAN